MCSEYNIRTSVKELESAIGQAIKNLTDRSDWDATIKFSVKAPVLAKPSEGLQLMECVFPVAPFPNARLSGFKNQTDANDKESDDPEDHQIRRIYEVPRWKKAFAATPYLIPMTSFTEFAYWGAEAGNALAFEIPKTKVFFAGGIALRPFMPKTGKEDGFAILTHTATPEMLDYHHRLIVLLEPEAAAAYLQEMDPEERFEYLVRNRYKGPLQMKKNRSMAKGWEKRAPLQNKKLELEQRYSATLKQEHIHG